MPESKEAKAKRIRRYGWIFFVTGFFYTAILGAVGTVLKKFSFLDPSTNIVNSYEFKISGYVVGLPVFLMVFGAILVGHEVLARFVEAWRGNQKKK